MSSTDRSVEAQEALARELWLRETELWLRETEQWIEAFDPPTLFKYCRHVLGLGLYDVTSGPLLGIITSRRLRRVENGQEDIPPRAWQVYADLLIDQDHADLAQRVAQVCPDVKLRT